MNVAMVTLRSSCQLLCFIATLLFITHATMGQLLRDQKLSLDRQLHEYRVMLKNENKTVFPDRDIRSLLNPGLRAKKPIRLNPTQTQRQLARSQHESGDSILPKPTGILDKGVSRPTKKGNTRRHRKKGNAKRKQRKTDIPNLLTDESNELEAKNLNKVFPHGQSSGNSKRSSSRKKERRRKSRRRRIRQRKIKSSKSSVVVTHISNLPPLKERCKTRPMKQAIKVKGCFSKTITNNFCYGQCNSYFIPETQGRGDGPPAFVSCGFCRPRTIRPIIVQLRCTGRNGHNRWRRKKVPYIKKCRCMAQKVDLDFL